MHSKNQKPHKGAGMEGWVARWYTRTRRNDMDDFRRQAQAVAEQLRTGSNVLEVAPGPGFFAIELAKLGDFRITGLDISRTFVNMAAKKAAEAGVRVNFTQGSASNMPFPRDSFDFLLCRAAFKNFAKPVSALQEMCRVLKPGGRGLIIDLKRDANPGEISRHVDAMGLSTVNRVLTKLAFRTMLLKSAYSKEQFERMLEQARFSGVQVNESGIGLEVWMTK